MTLVKHISKLKAVYQQFSEKFLAGLERWGSTFAYIRRCVSQ